MSDWDFLHDMHNAGYTADEIADAAGCGYNPWDCDPDFEDDDEYSKSCQQGDPRLAVIFEGLVDSARAYHQITGRYLQIWGELGELYAEVRYGIKRHKPHTRGSDGKLGNDFVEIKTISPEKDGEKVQVKRAGNFNRLLVVKIGSEFQFEGRFIKRKNLSKGDGTYARVAWSNIPEDEGGAQA